MSLESGTYLSDLVITNPLGSDKRDQGDDHIRLIKAVLKATFPNLNGPVNATPAQLNRLVGVTGDIQTQLDTKAPMPLTTVCLFYQAAAPTGWTQVTTQDNKALRVVSGVSAAGGTTGNDAGASFSVVFTSKAVTGTIGGTAITINQMPAHTHAARNNDGAAGVTTGGSYVNSIGNVVATTGSTGGSQTHDHTFTGTAINMAVQYINVILASRTT